MTSSVPKGKLMRSSVVALAAGKVGVRPLAHFSKRPFLSQEAKKKDVVNTEGTNAETIFKALVQLRGTALKVAQMLGMELGVLPERYRQELSKSYYQVPPLNRALIRKVMKQTLGDYPESVFVTFDDQAFAAASLGQAHLATTKSGEKLAVKVQYPGIESTIHSDIQLVKQLTRPMKEHKEIVAILEEVEARMREETNYVLEMENITFFAEHLQMPQVVIPQVYPQYSSQDVLCMEYLEGKHLNEWLKTKPTQEQKNQVAQTMYDIFMRSVFELRRFHADPNVGNYLFAENGQVGLIDFGCVKVLEPEFCQQYANLFGAILASDYEKLLDIYRDVGVLKVANQEVDKAYYHDALIPFFQWFSKPYQYEYFDFSKHQGFTSAGIRLGEAMRKHKGMKQGYIEVNQAFVYTDRTLYGLYKIFEELGAKVQMQNQWTGSK